MFHGSCYVRKFAKSTRYIPLAFEGDKQVFEFTCFTGDGLTYGRWSLQHHVEG
jgi:hypothetical protein